MEYTVKVSDEALEVMALAAIEAYCLGDGRGIPEEKLETLGYVWGYIRKIEDVLTVYYISKVAVSISATRECDSVEPHPEAATLKDAFMMRWAPHLTLLGDFHSHPYEDLNEVDRVKGYEFSSADYTVFAEDDLLWSTSGDMPVMLVMTICKLQRVREHLYEQVRTNVGCFSVGEFRFWLNASVGYLDDSGKRKSTGNKHSAVFLDLNSRFFNMSSDHIYQKIKNAKDKGSS